MRKFFSRYLTPEDAEADGWVRATKMSDLEADQVVLTYVSGALREGEVLSVGRTKVHVGTYKHADFAADDKVDPVDVWVGGNRSEPKPVVLLDAIFVEGTPRPKGSMKNVAKRGHKPVMVEDNIHSKPWRIHVKKAVVEHLHKESHLYAELPVKLTCDFVFQRPSSCQDIFPMNRSYGDDDKLFRNIGDALQDSGLIADDSQIVNLAGPKRWGYPFETSGAWITVTEVLLATGQ